MDNSFSGLSFDGGFGRVSFSFRHSETRNDLIVGFREYQRQRQRRHLKKLFLGSGIGRAAKKTVQDATYLPQSIFNETCVVNGDVLDSEEFAAMQGIEKPSDNEGEHKRPARVEVPIAFTALFQNSPATLLQSFVGVEEEVHTLGDVRKQLDENMSIANASIARCCQPHTFDEILESIAISLTAVEKGDPECKVTLPIQDERDTPLCGAERVAEFAEERLSPVAVQLSGPIYVIEWMLQYTMTFINSIITESEEEAQLRLEMLAECVRFLGKINKFTAFYVAFEQVIDVYDAFSRMRQTVEFRVEEHLSSVETTLRSILDLKLPLRRKRLFRAKEGILQRVRQVFVLINEIDTVWAPTIRLQVTWKDDFLSRVLTRIYRNIAPAFLCASLGFLDEMLYTQMNVGKPAIVGGRSSSTRRTGKRDSCANTMQGARLSASISSGKTFMPRMIEEHCVHNTKDLHRIGFAFKGKLSKVVGLQLCMGSRYMLNECGSEYDEKWGFSMNEVIDPSEIMSRAQSAVSRFAETVRRRARLGSQKRVELISDERQ
ncbi:hypothetical protein ERJ75_000705900 [Trypanosoma vivax]|uniref:Uncharacterized protein n=1 Tax=Trypanosoma vivax (strain Y486) TaxID=1055687 RepID=G0TU25_TRYVY|nr:hypothetical protein TRVL_00171 [Trypanosoma vivax]KAH8614081.1 hypothetical protein ERJ75_000705900 [Trypanosoma vivax]CCC47459.1 conserved hypothetical protein [Trypanosoma vivax Y486]